MIRLLLVLAFTLASMQVFSYENGEDFCLKNPIKGKSRFHRVYDSQFPHSEIKIHSYMLKDFDATKPTLLFFSGGPGSSPRASEFSLEGINVLFFEQRGMGCSRPATAELMLDSRFYQSDKTVSDAATILADYNINKAFIYGHSYGTVLASLFAHHYPEKVHKVVLEGVLFRGDLSIWKSEIRRKNLQKTLNSLSESDRLRVIELSKNGVLPSNWFSVIGTMMSYLDNGFEIYSNFLSNILTMDDESLASFVDSFYSPKGFLHVNALEADDGEVTFGMITCKELGAMNPEASFYMVFNEQNELVWDNNNKTKLQFCDPLGLKAEDEQMLDLSAFPINVPVVYLVGEDDGATDLNQAKAHAQHVSTGKKTFYLLNRGGHLPNLGALKENRDCHDEADCDSLKPIKAQSAFFEKLLLSSDPLTAADLAELNKALELSWRLL